MASDPLYQPITVNQFLAMDFGTDRKFELNHGLIQMMTGGSEQHAWVSGNLLTSLRNRLRRSGCRSYGSDMGIRIGDTDVRYPDASIHCGDRPDHADDVKALAAPRAIFEVLSPSTARYDQGTKLEEYRAIRSVDLIVFLDPGNELVITHHRIPRGWFVTTPAVRDIEIDFLKITLPHAEIFALD